MPMLQSAQVVVDSKRMGCSAEVLAMKDLTEGLAGDELAVLEAVADRLRVGRERYGQLVIDPDTRDWDREATEELLDFLVYRAIAQIRRDRDAARK